MMSTLLFAALAFFIFYKLSKQLGKIDEEEKKQIEEKIARRREEMMAMQNAVRQNQEAREQKVVSGISQQNISEQKILESLDEATRQNFIAILQRTNITAEFFVNGAKSSFEMILKAFATADLETLKFLLSDKIYAGFETAINQRKAAEKILITNVIAVEKAEIISAMLLDNFASVAVKLTSKQINYITDKNGQIIEGRKDEISEITDVWTFKKDVTSPNPNWVVSATSTN